MHFSLCSLHPTSFFFGSCFLSSLSLSLHPSIHVHSEGFKLCNPNGSWRVEGGHHTRSRKQKPLRCLGARSVGSLRK